MKTCVIVGGGLAGIAAAEAAARRGKRVTLLEWRRVLGGRAASVYDAATDVWLDNGQHIVLGCCTATLNLFARLGLDDCFERRDGVLFADTSQRRWKFAATRFLPKSLQFLPASFRIPFLGFSFNDRFRTTRAVRRLASVTTNEDISFAEWASREQLSAASLDTLWKPLLYSALSETLENVSLIAVRRVIQNGVLGGRDAMAMYIPNRSLREIFHTRTLAALESLGVEVRLGERVVRVVPSQSSVEIETHRGETLTADAAVLAIPTTPLWRLLQESSFDNEVVASLGLQRFEPAAITTLHLCFDRRILPERHDVCALLGGVGQMLFVSPRRDVPESCGVLHTVVVSASHQLLSESQLASTGRDALIAEVVAQIIATFPEIFDRGVPQLLYSRVTTVFDAVFSPKPHLFTARPPQQTPWPHLTIAGDWTQTDFPATFESAVRSGG